MNAAAVKRILRRMRKEELRTIHRIKVQITEHLQLSAILTNSGSVNLSFEGGPVDCDGTRGRLHMGSHCCESGHDFMEYVPHHAGMYLTRARIDARRFLCLRYWDTKDWHRVIIHDDDSFTFVKVQTPGQFEEQFYTLPVGFAIAMGVEVAPWLA